MAGGRHTPHHPTFEFRAPRITPGRSRSCSCCVHVGEGSEGLASFRLCHSLQRVWSEWAIVILSGHPPSGLLF